MDDFELRNWIYQAFAMAGRAPTSAELAAHVGSAVDASQALRRLHDAHLVVLDEAGEIAMALPFSARPTGHRVTNDRGSWDANCAWDTLAIPAALDQDATIEATWLDTGEPVELAIANGTVVGSGVDGLIHFAIPARRWWDDIVET